MVEGKSSILKSIGPGLLFAAASVGVSHLVQSTRAGAGFGLSLLPVALLALVLKYPLFEFGQRYAVATGTSLLEGYRQQGRWTLVIYLLLTLGTMFTVVAAVTYVSAGLAIQLSGWNWSALLWSAILILLAAGILVVGRYPLLDKAIKVMMVILTISTAAATVAVLPELSGIRLFGPIGLADIGFIVTFVGWMPTGMDVAVWQSLWVLARERQTGQASSLRHTIFDFRLGYVSTGVLAAMFILLGTVLMFDRGLEFHNAPDAFAGQVIELYTQSLGDWSWPVIALAAFTTIFSTLLTVLDGFPRALMLVSQRFRGPEQAEELQRRAAESAAYWMWMLLLAAGAMLILATLGLGDLKKLIDLATILSFMTAPFLGLLTYRAIISSAVPEEYQPSRSLRLLAQAGIALLGLLLIVFLIQSF
jgi:Mn2+/Fe2+ NRAMP family transporter